MSDRVRNGGLSESQRALTHSKQHRAHETPKAEFIATELRGILAKLPRHLDPVAVAGSVRPNPNVVQDEKVSALLEQIANDMQQKSSGTQRKFLKSGNEPGKGPHLPPPLGPDEHGVPPIYEALQVAAVKFEEVPDEMRIADRAENKPETAPDGPPFDAETFEKTGLEDEDPFFKALLRAFERLAVDVRERAVGPPMRGGQTGKVEPRGRNP